jgi:hypothetical protein
MARNCLRLVGLLHAPNIVIRELEMNALDQVLQVLERGRADNRSRNSCVICLVNGYPSQHHAQKITTHRPSKAARPSRLAPYSLHATWQPARRYAKFSESILMSRQEVQLVPHDNIRARLRAVHPNGWVCVFPSRFGSGRPGQQASGKRRPRDGADAKHLARSGEPATRHKKRLGVTLSVGNICTFRGLTFIYNGRPRGCLPRVPPRGTEGCSDSAWR